jgi:hypothetical protein
MDSYGTSKPMLGFGADGETFDEQNPLMGRISGKGGTKDEVMSHGPQSLLWSYLPRSPIPLLSTLTARATIARPLHPAELASVPSGIVLVRVRVRSVATFISVDTFLF